MQVCFSFARCLWKIKTGEDAAKQEGQNVRQELALGQWSQSCWPRDRIPKVCQQSRAQNPCHLQGQPLPWGVGKGLHCLREQADSLLFSSTSVRLRRIFLLRNKGEFWGRWECQVGKSNSRWVAAHDKDERGRSVRTGSVCLLIKDTVCSAISKHWKGFGREVRTEQGKPGELDRFSLARG